MTLFEALEQGHGSAIYTGNKPAYVFVETMPSGAYRITTSQAEEDRATRRLHEVTVGTADDLALRVTAEPFVCDPFADWAPLPDR